MTKRQKWAEGGVVVAVYLPREHVDLLKETAEVEQTAVSEIVRRALRKYFSLPKNDSNAARESA